MKKIMYILLSLVLAATSVVDAVERPLTGDANRWNGGAGGKTSVNILAQSPLEISVTVGGGPEGFPCAHWGTANEEDWRLYNRIAFEVKLESEDSGIRDGGKKIALCLYDNGCRHESIAGKPHRQQCFASPTIKEGQWQDVVLDLSATVRSRVSGLDIYLYDMPYNYPHTYRFTFRHIRLLGEDPSLLHFDKTVYSVKKLTGRAGEAAGKLQAGNDLSMTLSKDGGILNVSTGNRSVGDGRNQVSGILLRDAKTDLPPFMAGGNIRQDDSAFRQTAKIPAMNLNLQATYRSMDDRLVVEGRIESTNAEDRAITVYVALPITEGKWQWFKEMNRSVVPFEEMKKVPPYEESDGSYPVAVLADRTSGRGLGFLLDQARPMNYRFGVNPRERLFYVAFDFGLLDEKKADGGATMRAADFYVEIVRTDPDWGLRSALEKLYASHPENFVDRVGHGGGWEVDGGRRNSKNSPEELIAGGYRFDWSAVENSPELWEWNVKHQVRNLIYVEPDFLQFSVGDFPSPTPADVKNRLDKLDANDEEEWQKFLPLHYSRAAISNQYLKDRDLRSYLTILLKSLKAGVMYDRHGEPVLGLGYRIGWIGNSGFGAMAPANLAPGIPGGRGTVILEEYYDFIYKKIADQGLTPPDGFALDSLMEVPHDYRRENFRYMKAPISFDPETKQLMVPHGFGSVEWLDALRQRYADRNGLIMGNCFGPMIFASTRLDILGIENTQFNDPQLYRALAGPKKPLTFLPYDPPAKDILDYHLFWGIYPGRSVSVDILRPMIPVLDALYAASWQPVTGIRCDSEEIQLERFGKKDAPFVYVTVHNLSAAPKTVELSLSSEQCDKREKASGVYNGSEIFPIKNNRLKITLEGRETKVLRLE